MCSVQHFPYRMENTIYTYYNRPPLKFEIKSKVILTMCIQSILVDPTQYIGSETYCAGENTEDTS